MMAVPETTDYDTIAEDYSAKIDERPWNALYERPTTLALLPTVNNTDVLDAGYLNAELIEEEWGWLGKKMRYYRRPLRDLTEPLADAGFLIERLCEPTPSEEFKLRDPKGYDRLCRLPAFIFVRARKGARD